MWALATYWARLAFSSTLALERAGLLCPVRELRPFEVSYWLKSLLELLYAVKLPGFAKLSPSCQTTRIIVRCQAKSTRLFCSCCSFRWA